MPAAKRPGAVGKGGEGAGPRSGNGEGRVGDGEVEVVFCEGRGQGAELEVEDGGAGAVAVEAEDCVCLLGGIGVGDVGGAGKRVGGGVKGWWLQGRHDRGKARVDASPTPFLFFTLLFSLFRWKVALAGVWRRRVAVDW